MSEISFQAVQFLPRLLTIVAFLGLAWLIARFARYLVLRATCECRDQVGMRQKIAKGLALIAQGSIILLVLPFGVEATGFHAPWLHTWQQFEIQIFINWPVWMVLSLVAAGIAFLVRGVPRFYVQLKGSFETSHHEAQS